MLWARIAMIGATRKEKTLLEQLSKRHKSFFKIIGEALSKDEDYSQTNIVNPALGTEVLRRQVESEKQEKAEIQILVEECRKIGIAEWRIKLVI